MTIESSLAPEDPDEALVLLDELFQEGSDEGATRAMPDQLFVIASQ